MKEQKIGFVGLGTMGAPMATNIAQAEFDLRVYDINPEAATELGGRIGAAALTDAVDLADCDVVIFMLPNSAIVRSVLFTSDQQMKIPFTSSTALVDMSSSDPVQTQEIGKLLAAQGVSLVDAPVSGARERATDGTLSIMLGADDEGAAEQAVPVIEAMSQRIFRTGPLGTGHAMKALNNFVAAASYAASSEAMIAGERFGLDPAVMVDIFNASTGQSFVTTHVLPEHIVGGQFSSGFALPLMAKDVRIAHELQNSMNREAPVCSAVTEVLEQALDALGNVDHTRAYEFWRDNS